MKSQPPLLGMVMVRVWSKDDPKAGLMERKRALIVDAARRAFLEEGYAGSSVNRIAAAAGVSIKTLYRHFESKDDLFKAVMEAACRTVPARPDDVQDWSELPPERGAALAGEEYLRHALAPEQLDLYRVVIRDATRFPELGARYEAEVVGRRVAIFAAYLERWSKVQGWPLRDGNEAARTFAALLDVGMLDTALQGGVRPDAKALETHAQLAADRLVVLIRAGLV